MTQKDVEVLEKLTEYHHLKMERDHDGDWEVMLWVTASHGAKRGFGDSIAQAGEAAMRKWEDQS